MSNMRKFINLLEAASKRIKEQADADNMYGDDAKLNTFGRRNGQEFTDRGRADVTPRPNINARFGDNSMLIEDDDDSDMEQLHQALTRVGLTDEELMISNKLPITQEAKQRIAARLGISPETVDALYLSLVQNLRDADAQSTDALIDDYYSFMESGKNIPMVCRTMGEGKKFVDDDDLEDKKKVKDRDSNRSLARNSKLKDRESLDEKKFVDDDDLDDKKKIKDRDSNRSLARNSKLKDRESLDETEFNHNTRIANPGEAVKLANKNVRMANPGEAVRLANYNTRMAKTVKETKRPFDFGVMNERYTFERDALGNITIRDTETGNEKFFKGSKASEISNLLKSDDQDNVMRSLMERNVEDITPDFMSEIRASAGTYNFEWNFDGKHGTGTVMFDTNSDLSAFKLISVRDEDGEELPDVSSKMHKELLDQAKDFIGNE